MVGPAARWSACAVAIAAGLCGSDAPAHVADRAPVALRVVKVRLPATDAPRVKTRGSYPRVSGGSQDLAKVNASLRDEVRAAQSSYARLVRRYHGPPGTGDGTFATSPRVGLTSASSVVVSSLIELTELIPGGNADGQGWLAVTARVPSGERVGIEDLFADPAKGLAALADAARSRLLAANDCVKRSQDDPIVGDINRKGFAPTARHYRHFALTAGGLAVGFGLGDVAGISCGRVRVTVPYETLRPVLSGLGNQLVDGVRAPRR